MFAVSFFTERDDWVRWRGYAGDSAVSLIGIPASVLADNSYPIFALLEPIIPVVAYLAKFDLVGTLKESGHHQIVLRSRAPRLTLHVSVGLPPRTLVPAPLRAASWRRAARFPVRDAGTA